MRRAVPTLGLFDAFEAPAPKPLPPRAVIDPAVTVAPATAPEEAVPLPPPAAEPPRGVQGLTAAQAMQQPHDMLGRALGLLERASPLSPSVEACMQSGMRQIAAAQLSLASALTLHARQPAAPAAQPGMPPPFADWAEAEAWLRATGYRPRNGGGYEAAGRPWIEIIEAGDGARLRAVHGGSR